VFFHESVFVWFVLCVSFVFFSCAAMVLDGAAGEGGRVRAQPRASALAQHALAHTQHTTHTHTHLTCVDLDAGEEHGAQQVQQQRREAEQQQRAAPQRARHRDGRAEHGGGGQAEQRRGVAAHVEVLLEEDVEHRVGVHVEAELGARGGDERARGAQRGDKVGLRVERRVVGAEGRGGDDAAAEAGDAFFWVCQ
jgi:hypothetical protein